LIKGIFFDLGGTLWQPFGYLDLAGAIDKAAGELFCRVLPGAKQWKSRELSRAVYEMITQRYPGELRERDCFQEFSRCFETAGLRFEQDMAEHVYHTFVYNLARLYRVYDEVPAVLRALRCSRRYVTGVVSNTIFPGKIMKTCLDESGLGSVLDFCIFSSDVGWRKPHPKIYQAALNVSRLKPGEVLFVGDRFVEDVEGPKSMGMKAILLNRDTLINKSNRPGISHLGELISLDDNRLVRISGPL
jgi:HAD superfamily hydrolase (TIGR01549 family)